MTLARGGALSGRWSLDPQASRVEFRVRHFWHAVTVRGWFERVEGEGTVAPDGTFTGRLVIDASSLATKNRQRPAPEAALQPIAARMIEAGPAVQAQESAVQAQEPAVQAQEPAV